MSYRVPSKAQLVEASLRQLIMALAHEARNNGREELADELEAIEESFQRHLSAKRS